MRQMLTCLRVCAKGGLSRGECGSVCGAPQALLLLLWSFIELSLLSGARLA